MNISDTFWLTVLLQIQTAAVFLCVIMFLTLPPQGRRDFLELGLIMFVAFATMVAGTIVIHVFHKNPNFTSNLFNITDLPLAILYFRRRFTFKHKNVVAWTLIALGLTFNIINIFWIQGPYSLGTYMFAVISLSYVIMSIIHLFTLINKNSESIIAFNATFLISTAMLIYYSVIFTLELLADYLYKVMNNNLIVLWLFHNSMGLLFYLAIAYTLWLIRKEYLNRQTS